MDDDWAAAVREQESASKQVCACNRYLFHICAILNVNLFQARVTFGLSF